MLPSSTASLTSSVAAFAASSALGAEFVHATKNNPITMRDMLKNTFFIFSIFLGLIICLKGITFNV